MTIHVGVRLILAIILSIIGWHCGKSGSSLSFAAGLIDGRYYPALYGILGALIGFVVAPLVVGLPLRAIRHGVQRLPVRGLLLAVLGVVPGLVVAALLAPALSMLPGTWGKLLPIVASLLLGSLGAIIASIHGAELCSLLGWRLAHSVSAGRREVMLLDTSVIIDGRIADIGNTGFIRGTMLVPRFVLDELQYIADSPDALRRNRGRRGLEILGRMQKDDSYAIEVSEDEVPEIREVDGKLTRLAQELDCPILTNDYNLNRVAELQGIEVLNINELANAVKAVVLPGETLRVRILQEGRELGQGVGYLDDGTMVVVEDGRRHLNTTVNITVTRVLQTVAGRMIFGQMPNAKRT
jgi:uncharacterized protein YacL